MTEKEERAIRAVVSGCVEAYASGFSDRHLAEIDDEDGTINMKIHNVFIAALGADIQYYSALARSLDSSLGNVLEKMAIKIATLNYDVSQHVEGEAMRQGCVLHSSPEDEHLTSRAFWNMVCKSENGYDVVNDEYKKSIHHIIAALIDLKGISIEKWKSDNSDILIDLATDTSFLGNQQPCCRNSHLSLQDFS